MKDSKEIIGKKGMTAKIWIIFILAIVICGRVNFCFLFFFTETNWAAIKILIDKNLNKKS